MKEPVHSGVARLRPDRPVDRVEAVEGTAEALGGPAGQEVRELGLPRLTSPLTRPHRGADAWRTPLPPWAMRLSRRLRGVRRRHGDGSWDVTWADDGRTCQVREVRPAD